MKKCLIIYEDDNAISFNPLTLLRPVYFLRPGIRCLYEKIVDSFPGYTPYLFCRPEIAALTEDTVNMPVNQFNETDVGEVAFINGRLKLQAGFAEAVMKAGENVILESGGAIAAFKSVGSPTGEEMSLLREGDLAGFVNRFENKAQRMDVDLRLYNYLWDFVNDIEDSVVEDFEYFKTDADATGYLAGRDEMKREGREYAGVELLKPENIYISRDAEILPGTVLDARSGPIFIGSRVKVEPLTYVVGPAYVGKESLLVGGKISVVSIGPLCRVGGEVEETIIQGYTNKYHAGFLGHSYVGEWINLGAMTTNSDLKNNYSDVLVSVNGEMVNTGSIKVGSFIGDFTKTAIGTLLNTGINIGISCNIVADGLITDKEISSFTWYSPRHKMKYNFVKALGTIERSMARRKHKPSEALRGRLEEISNSINFSKG